MLLDQLKTDTRPAHTRLESLIGLPRSLPDHIRQLEGFLGIIEPWEESLEARLPPEDLLRAGRMKTPWLKEDLASFGFTPAQIGALPRSRALADAADTRPAMLGVAYVLEGATLGGQMISRHLEGVLGLSHNRGYRYFRSYGPEVGARWQEFRAELLRHSSPANDPVILDAARTAFSALHTWFSSRPLIAA